MNQDRTLKITRYEKPTAQGYIGSQEPATPEGAYPGWLMYFRADGSADVWRHRDPDGGVVGEPIHLPAVANGAPVFATLEAVEQAPSVNVTINIAPGVSMNG